MIADEELPDLAVELEGELPCKHNGSDHVGILGEHRGLQLEEGLDAGGGRVGLCDAEDGGTVLALRRGLAKSVPGVHKPGGEGLRHRQDQSGTALQDLLTIQGEKAGRCLAIVQPLDDLHGVLLGVHGQSGQFVPVVFQKPADLPHHQCQQKVLLGPVGEGHDANQGEHLLLEGLVVAAIDAVVVVILPHGGQDEPVVAVHAPVQQDCGKQ